MTAVITAITNVFSAIIDWLVHAMPSVIEIFWTAGADGDGELTFLGTLVLIGLAISVFFLILGILQRWLKLGA